MEVGFCIILTSGFTIIYNWSTWTTVEAVGTIIPFSAYNPVGIEPGTSCDLPWHLPDWSNLAIVNWRIFNLLLFVHQLTSGLFDFANKIEHEYLRIWKVWKANLVEMTTRGPKFDAHMSQINFTVIFYKVQCQYHTKLSTLYNHRQTLMQHKVVFVE